MDIAEQIVLVNHGRIEQVGTARELYEHPHNEFVMSSIGPVNRLGDSYLRPHDIHILTDPDETAAEASSSESSTSALRYASSSDSTTGAKSGRN